MKIFICASKHCYGHIAPVKETLEKNGHLITLPNSYDDPGKEEEMRILSADEHKKWKANMLRLQGEKVMANDAILVINMEKNGQKNYIGGATFLEIFKAFELGKKIYFFNPLPENILKDELLGMGPIIIKGNLNLID